VVKLAMIILKDMTVMTIYGARKVKMFSRVVMVTILLKVVMVMTS